MTHEELGLPWCEKNYFITNADGRIVCSEEEKAFAIHAANSFFAMRDALRNLSEACWVADTNQNLSEEIDGTLLIASDKALALADSWGKP